MAGEDGTPTVEQLQGQVAETSRLMGISEQDRAAAIEARTAAETKVAELESARATAEGERDAARAEVERLKTAASRVPGGGDERKPADLSSLSPGEKIRQGIALKRGS